MSKRPVVNSYAYLGGYKAITVTASGLRIFLDTRELNSMNLVTHGIYEHVVEEVFRRFLSAGNKMVDVGANIGYHTLTGASLVGNSGTVYSFEPNPNLFNLLRESVVINNFKSRVKLFQKAVHNEETKCMFQWQDGEHRCGTLVLANTKRKNSNIIEVDTVKLDDIIEEESLPLDLMKVDVEGAEPYVIESAKNILDRSPDIKIILEWNPSNMRTRGYDPHKLVEFLKKYDYSIYWIKVPGKFPKLSYDELLTLKGTYNTLICREKLEN